MHERNERKEKKNRRIFRMHVSEYCMCAFIWAYGFHAGQLNVVQEVKQGHAVLDQARSWKISKTEDYKIFHIIHLVANMHLQNDGSPRNHSWNPNFINHNNNDDRKKQEKKKKEKNSNKNWRPAYM